MATYSGNQQYVSTTRYNAQQNGVLTVLVYTAPASRESQVIIKTGASALSINNSTGYVFTPSNNVVYYLLPGETIHSTPGTTYYDIVVKEYVKG